ncbi:MAG: NCS2 family permease [Propionibacteriaceae bacterium]|nr:NCS2 family permease [Propionibacteriaceae bacterium]
MFKLKEYGANARTEIIAGLTMFAAMAYIIPVNASILGQTGTPDNPFPVGAIILATCIAAAAGSLLMALWANVPYGMAPGMGLNAFFTFTVVFALGFTWQQALGMVFLSGVIDLIVTATGIRKHIVASLPKALRSAMGVGIGLFIAYIGIKDAGLLSFTSDPGTYTMLGDDPASATIIAGAGTIPAIVAIKGAVLILAVIAIALTIILYVMKVPGAILISIIAMTIVAAFFGLVHMDWGGYIGTLGQSFKDLGGVFGQSVVSIPSLFSDPSKIILAIATIFAFSMTGLFDELGTSLGLGRATGIFSEEEIDDVAKVKGFHTRFARSLVPPSIATMFGSLFGTSNTTTYVESSAGIAAGGKTGMTAATTGVLFLASIVLAPLAMAVPSLATAPALIMVGALMIRPVKDIDWTDMEASIPAFLAIAVMPFAYSITTGIAVGVIFYCLIKLFRGKFKEIHPVLAIIALLFVAYFVNMALA